MWIRINNTLVNIGIAESIYITNTIDEVVLNHWVLKITLPGEANCRVFDFKTRDEAFDAINTIANSINAVKLK
jgi:hypothetical protein